ncbi:hypothetical protein KCP78_06185 [Salmonella enterica subsp. enterica]|nr:hypothetical protein KCP78_06185 [Salmonella enterica subsp. enterica]
MYRKGSAAKSRRQRQPERAGRRNVRLTRFSGCGKTTTLKMINRLVIAPSGGNIQRRRPPTIWIR